MILNEHDFIYYAYFNGKVIIVKSVILFTKDRVDRLQKSIKIASNISVPVSVIDDSCLQENRIKNKYLCDENSAHYHGIKEQSGFLSLFNKIDLDRIVTTLGKETWSLGFNRNYAILYALSKGYEKVIFTDDDVLIPDIRSIDAIFDNLEWHNHIGVDIENMPDDSVVGHIYRAGHLLQARYVSGTFLGVDLTKPVNNFYLNIYNEDWIWLYLENRGNPVFKVGKVGQMRFDPFQNGVEKALFQEFGEICWEGVLGLDTDFETDRLKQEAYWKKVIYKRLRDIKNIDNLVMHPELSVPVENIKNALMALHAELRPSMFSNLFNEYYEGLDHWNYVLNVAREL